MDLGLLVTSAGRRVELLHCFRADATRLGVKLRVMAADAQPGFSAACQVADQAFEVPRCTAVDYVPRLLELCQQHRVGLLVPTIDTELQVLADCQDEFARYGTRVCISSSEIVRMARNKSATANFLALHEIPTPRTAEWPVAQEGLERWNWPLIVKPVDGSCSKDIYRLREHNDIGRLPPLRGEFVVQEMWEGTEYTVNLFFDRHGKLLTAIPHQRIEIRAGEVSKGFTERIPELMLIADQLGVAMNGARGAVCFQAIVRPSGEVAVFEINARFGGGFPLAHAAGARFTEWLILECLGHGLEGMSAWEEGVRMLRYDAAVFIRSSLDS